MIEDSNKRLRLIELVMVIAVAFSTSIVKSVYTLLLNIPLEFPKDTNLFFISDITHELSAVIVLVYILFRQGNTIKTIGFVYSLKDILHSFGLIIVSIISAYLFKYIMYYLNLVEINSFPNNVEFIYSKVTVFYLIFVLINPIFEELIVRGFVITEVLYMTGKGYVAVIASVLIQISYHLYQGFVPALNLGAIFLVYSLYFLKFKRLIPVIIAHAFFDILSVVIYGSR